MKDTRRPRFEEGGNPPTVIVSPTWSIHLGGFTTSQKQPRVPLAGA